MNTRSILVVEDSATELLFMRNMLVAEGYAVSVATDGEEALRKALEQQPGLMLLDVVLPKKNGFQVCRQLKSSPATAGIHVVIVTGKDQESDRYWAFKQGADEYFVKPVRAEDLLSVIAKYV